MLVRQCDDEVITPQRPGAQMPGGFGQADDCHVNVVVEQLITPLRGVDLGDVLRPMSNESGSLTIDYLNCSSPLARHLT
jgi:hypothetical protein